MDFNPPPQPQFDTPDTFGGITPNGIPLRIRYARPRTARTKNQHCAFFFRGGIANLVGDGPGGGMPNVARWIPSAAPPRLGPAAIFVMHAQEPHGPKTTTTLTLCTQAPHLVSCHGAFAAAPRRSTAKMAGGGHAAGRASKKSGGGALSMLHHTHPHQTSDFVLKMHTKQAHDRACVRYMLGFGI